MVRLSILETFQITIKRAQDAHAVILGCDVEVQGISKDKPGQVGEQQLPGKSVNPPKAVCCQCSRGKEHCTGSHALSVYCGLPQL